MSEGILAVQATCSFCVQQLVRAGERLRGGARGAVTAVKGQVTVGEKEKTPSSEALRFELDYCPVTPLTAGILQAASNFRIFLSPHVHKALRIRPCLHLRSQSKRSGI